MTDDKKIYTDIDEDEEKSAGKKAKGEKKEKDDFVELLKALGMAAMIALTIRTFLFEPFNIPSASMYPSLLIGDYLFVEKYSYGYSQYSFPLNVVKFEGRVMKDEPETGDVVVFRQPHHEDSTNFIKRLIGKPGDTVQVKEGRLYINGDMVKREWIGTEQRNDGYNNNLYNKYKETLPNGTEHFIYEISDTDEYDNTPEYIVPEGYYFMMGDNRDGSRDSRAQADVGFVPEKNLVGRAALTFYSSAGMGDKCVRDGLFGSMKSVGCKMIEWPKSIRFSRMFRRVRNL